MSGEEWDAIADGVWKGAIGLHNGRDEAARRDDNDAAIDLLLAVAAYLAAGEAAYYDGHARRQFARNSETRAAIEHAHRALYGRSPHENRFTDVKRKLLNKIHLGQVATPGDQLPNRVAYFAAFRRTLIRWDGRFDRLTTSRIEADLGRTRNGKPVSDVTIAAEWIAECNALDARGRSKDEIKQDMRDKFGRTRRRPR